MIELTKIAKEQLDTNLSGKETAPIRIHLAGRCGGPQLALSLDTQKEEDQLYTVDGYIFLIDTKLMNEAQYIIIDFNYYTGFKFKSNLNTQIGCGSCTACG